MKIKLYKYRNYFIIAAVTAFLVYSGYEYYCRYFNTLRNPSMLKKVIMSYGKYSVFAFIMLQIIQVVAFFIPGEIIQIAGGYIYGTLFGSLISFAGITIGSALVYILSHNFGKPLVDKIVPAKTNNFFKEISGSKKINIIVFIIYLIPGMPKDVMAYICGISDINLKFFLVCSSAGRLPGIIISAYFGHNVILRNWFAIIFIAVTMTALFMFGALKGEKIIRKLTQK